jgi:hypothetical protein
MGLAAKEKGFLSPESLIFTLQKIGRSDRI